LEGKGKSKNYMVGIFSQLTLASLSGIAAESIIALRVLSILSIGVLPFLVLFFTVIPLCFATPPAKNFEARPTSYG
jgi:hypothetical protein